MMKGLLPQRDPATIALVVIATAVVLVGLVYGRSLLIPLVIALLLWNLLDAMAERLAMIGLGRTIGTIIAVAVAMAGLGLFAWVLAGQIDAIANAWPRYVARLSSITSDVSDWLGPELAGRVRDNIVQFDVVSPLRAMVDVATSFFGGFGLVALYVAFMLAEQESFSSKIRKLFATADGADRFEAVLDSISNGIRRYLWIKTLMSLLTAGLSYAVLRTLEVDFAETWSLVIFLLNYIPSIGSILGVLFPAAIALVQFDTLWPFLVIVLALTTVQFAIGNVLEPMLTGQSLNLSPFVVILSLTFWGTIWGLPGMFLSVPMTAMAMIVCSNVPGLQWLAVMLSTRGQFAQAEADPDKA